MALLGETTFGFASYEDLGDHGGREVTSQARLAALIARDETIDLALLSALGAPMAHPYAYVSGAPIASGDRVHIVGHTTGLPYSYTPGWISDIRGIPGPEPIHGQFIQVFSGAWGGNSGGGMWDESGGLIGICSFRTTGAPLTFFVARDTVADFLARNLV
jgi:S1-C subfamily serine protease